MGALLREEEDTELLSLSVRVPRHLPFGVAESLEEGMAKAVDILVNSTAFQDLSASADNVARLMVTQVRPGSIMLEDRIGQMATVKKVFEEGDWLTAEDINKLQKNPPAKKSLPASDWKRRGRIFSVSYDGKEYYPRYQFDAMYQPLPVVSDILKAYGECADTWSIATWFHFPNGWIAREVGNEAVPVAPKDALDRSTDVIKAARNQKGTYVA
jgi:hypothetical protein